MKLSSAAWPNGHQHEPLAVCMKKAFSAQSSGRGLALGILAVAVMRPSDLWPDFSHMEPPSLPLSLQPSASIQAFTLLFQVHVGLDV